MGEGGDVDQLRIGYPLVVESTDSMNSVLPYEPLPLPLLLSAASFLMVGGDRGFKLALTEKDEEFSDELREDCVVKGCPLETKEHLSTMMSPVHVDTVTQWLQTTRVLSYS